MDLKKLRAFAVRRSLFDETSLERAITRLGFVQADPIRAPARAQDLTLRHRVVGYAAGDLDARYAELDVEEDNFINYGFLPRKHLALMHPRTPRRVWDAVTKRRAAKVLDFVRARGEAHPRDAEAHFAYGKVTNYWGGSSNAATHLLDAMHYRGLLRVIRRDGGVRVYAPGSIARGTMTRSETADALVALVVEKYAPLPASSLGPLVSRLRYAAPQLTLELEPALARARAALAHTVVDGLAWYWPAHDAVGGAMDERVRFLAPFDPVVWDRRRFELFWGWAYRFEAYTPAKKRLRGYYALPLLFRDEVLGWGNFSTEDGALVADVGYVRGRAPRDRAFKRELDAEIERMRVFLA
ncbi:MAG TPA: crosslink repair DNA glycosylase YcaQ family protein [Polyangiaceae bacterium]